MKKPIRKKPRWRVAKDWQGCSAEDGEWSELDILDTEETRKITVSIPNPGPEDDAAYLAGEALVDEICAFLNRRDA